MKSERVLLEIPGKQLTLSLMPSAFLRLEQQVNEVIARQLPGCGGILLGRKNPDRPESVYIESCFPVPSSTAGLPAGSSAGLLDPWLLKRALDLWQRRSDAALYAVGQYRVVLDSDHKVLEHLNWEDFASDDVLFEIRGKQPLTRAAVYIIGEHRSSGSAPDLEVPFGDISPSGTTSPDLGSRPEKSLAPSEIDSASSPMPQSVGQPGKHLQLQRAKIASAICVSVVVLALLVISGNRHRTFAARSNDTASHASLLLGLRPVRTGSGWEIHWNPRSAVMSSAYRGELTVSDLLVRRRIEITPADLGVGQLLYVSDAEDLTFELDIFARDGRGVSDSVRVGTRTSVNETDLPGDVDGSGKFRRPLPETLGRVVEHLIPSTGDKLAPQRTASKSAERPLGGMQTPKSDEPPDVGVPPNPNFDSAHRGTSPSSAGALEPRAALPNSSAISNLVPAPATDGPTGVPNTLAPIAETLLPTSIQRPPPFQQLKPAAHKTALVAPSIVSRSAAAYPEVAKSLKIAGTVRLDVTIGKKGELLDVTDVSGPLLLRTAAITSARRWQFAPATVNGTPVEAPLTIFVNFQLRD